MCKIFIPILILISIHCNAQIRIIDSDSLNSIYPLGKTIVVKTKKSIVEQMLSPVFSLIKVDTVVLKIEDSLLSNIIYIQKIALWIGGLNIIDTFYYIGIPHKFIDINLIDYNIRYAKRKFDLQIDEEKWITYGKKSNIEEKLDEFTYPSIGYKYDYRMAIIW